MRDIVDLTPQEIVVLIREYAQRFQNVHNDTAIKYLAQRIFELSERLP